MAKKQAKAARPKKAAAPSSTEKMPRPAKKARPPLVPNAEGVVLLTGGNPQIAKADGEAPVQAFIQAMPGWKREIGRGLDALITRTVPNVRKAVRWNTPFYGVEGQGWFLGFHCLTKYIKVAFYNGTSLRPIPPVESKHKTARYYHIPEGSTLDEELLASWIEQAADMPGEKLF